MQITLSINVDDPKSIKESIDFLKRFTRQVAYEPKTAKSSYSINDVRSELSTKVKDNRAAIKAKLSELGASSVTNLEESKYETFVDYLKSL
jgi:hypothetical protein